MKLKHENGVDFNLEFFGKFPMAESAKIYSRIDAMLSRGFYDKFAGFKRFTRLAQQLQELLSSPESASSAMARCQNSYGFEKCQQIMTSKRRAFAEAKKFINS